MAARIEILDLKLEDQVDHIWTDWEISTTLAFNAVVARSTMDKVNKTDIMFQQVFNPNVKYYARARALLSTGYTIWGNIDVTRPKRVNDIGDNDDIPSRISIPVITTDSNDLEHDITLFKISVTGFSALGTANHSATSWFIETLEGVPIWSRVFEEVDMLNILVDDVILESNTAYRIKAMFHSSSNDASQMVSKTIRTSDSSTIELATYLDDIDITTSVSLEINSVDNATGYTYELLELDRGLVTQLWSASSTETTAIIPANIMINASVYILRIKDNYTNVWKYFTFTTQPLQ